MTVFQQWHCHRVARTTRWNWWRTQPVTRSPVPASRPVTRLCGECWFQQTTKLPLVQPHRAALAPTRASMPLSLLWRPAGQSVTGRPSQWTRRTKLRTGLCTGRLSNQYTDQRPGGSMSDGSCRWVQPAFILASVVDFAMLMFVSLFFVFCYHLFFSETERGPERSW